MEDTAARAVAIVGAGAILPDATNVSAFWENIKSGRYSITEVRPDRWDPADVRIDVHRQASRENTGRSQS